MTKFSAPQQNQLAQIGAFLRENREKQAKSLEDIAIRTYIRPQLLNGIETGNPDTLPEPIFVQGFIRRYAEALGLNGVDLAQQFTVTSIPSTPRPARPAPPVDSATTRLTRPSDAGPSDAGVPSVADTADTSIPMFSAGGASFAETQMGQGDDLLTLGKESSEPLFESNPDFDAAVNGIATSDVGTDTIGADVPLETAADATSLDAELKQQLEVATGSSTESADDDFASKIAAFDQANLEEPYLDQTSVVDQTSGASTELSEPPVDRLSDSPSSYDLPVEQPISGQTALSQPTEPPALEEVSLNNQSDLDATANTAFDDDLPAAYTTEAEPFIPQTSREPMPVGVDYGDQPNLKPFIIGGVLAAIAVLALLLASVLGGGNRQPQVADTVEPAESSEAVTELPELPEPVEPTTPPASTAPVFVEAEVTEEAWVSVEADGNTIFEGILQPGDTNVWEAEERISVYSANAGGVTLAANGGDSEVMGASGQLAEKIFPQ